ncbi:hypothetical protein IMZ48_11785 [Candidatus Bathyarchaeota archaeon]|nr:hypothetical protein [Candidatus Bathyarchaeota archaeon]
MDRLWDHWNKGVSFYEGAAGTLGCFWSEDANGATQRQWKDIRHKYVEDAGDEE